MAGVVRVRAIDTPQLNGRFVLVQVPNQAQLNQRLPCLLLLLCGTW